MNDRAPIASPTRRAALRAALSVCALGALALTGCRYSGPGNVVRALGNAAAQSSGPAPQVGLMTFNIRFKNAKDDEAGVGWDARKQAVAEVIKCADPDIVGLQEALAPQADDLSTLLPHMGRFGVGREDGKAGGEHVVVLYHTARFDLQQHGDFWLSPTPEFPGSKGWGNRIPRMCTWGLLRQRDTGRQLLVLNTHLDHQSQPSRERAIELLAQRMVQLRTQHGAHVPIVLMGDFNVGEDNPVAQFAVGARPRALTEITGTAEAPPSTGLLCAFRAAYPREVTVGTFNGFKPGQTDGAMIDYILVPVASHVRSAQIIRTAHGPSYPSDHFPVAAQIDLWPR
jgi:endonuclease/exonuclease/phosphatase family metal-dependent hydrolase